MALGPKTQAYYEKYTALTKAKKAINHPFDMTTLRASMNTFFKAQFCNMTLRHDVSVSQETLRLNDSTVHVTIYKPHGAHGSLPVIIFHPGGGLALDMSEFHTHICMTLSHSAQAAVVCIQPPLSPEHKLPLILDLAYDATKHYYVHANQYGFLANQLIISGYSMGGTLAALICARAISDHELHIKAQVIISGVFDLLHSPENNNDFMYDALIHKQFVELCLPENAALESETFMSQYSPLAIHFQGAPPTYLITGEHDAFRKDAENMYAKLKHELVTTELTILPGLIHNSLLLYPLMDDGDNPAEIAAKYAKRCFLS